MRFKNFFRIFVGFTLFSLLLDYSVTVWGFHRYIAFMEINPHIMFLMRYMDPNAAASIVLLATLALVLASYRATGKYFKKPPYNRGLGRVWRHLWLGSPTRRDLVIFAPIALYLYLAYIHLWGAWTWISLFLRHGF